VSGGADSRAGQTIQRVAAQGRRDYVLNRQGTRRSAVQRRSLYEGNRWMTASRAEFRPKGSLRKRAIPTRRWPTAAGSGRCSSQRRASVAGGDRGRLDAAARAAVSAAPLQPYANDDCRLVLDLGGVRQRKHELQVPRAGREHPRTQALGRLHPRGRERFDGHPNLESSTSPMPDGGARAAQQHSRLRAKFVDCICAASRRRSSSPCSAARCTYAATKTNRRIGWRATAWATCAWTAGATCGAELEYM